MQLRNVLITLGFIASCSSITARDALPNDPYDDAVRYYNGDGGFALDRKKACDLFKISADLGNVYGVLALGDCYLIVAEYPKDPDSALELYERAADQGSRRGKRAFVAASLATKYQKAPKAKDKARSLLAELLRSTPNDDHLLFVRGVDQIATGRLDNDAIETLKRASERGSPHATALLGCLSRSCKKECGALGTERQHKARFSEIAADTKTPLASYASMSAVLRNDLPIGKVCGE